MNRVAAESVSTLRSSPGMVMTLAIGLAAACGSHGSQPGPKPPPPAAPTLSYAGATGTTVVLGTAMKVAPTTLSPNGAAVTQCGIKPGSANASSFPAALAVDSSTCVIAGTPAAELPATEFTLVATNSAGTSADATVTLTIHIGWLKQLGATSASSNAQGVAVDGSGNSYVAGYTTAGLAGNTQSGNQDYFIAKHGTAGTLAWLAQLGVASQTSQAYGVAVDASGNSYVAGSTTGGLAGNTQNGAEDFFIAKYDASGNRAWLKQLGIALKSCRVYGITVDAAGNIYVAGSTTGGLAGNVQTGVEDYFIARYDGTGTLTWIKQAGVAYQASRAYGIAADAAGNLYLAGLTTVNQGGGTQIGDPASFVAKYDTSGTRTWLKQIVVSSKSVVADGVAVDGSGNIYIAGLTNTALPGNTQTGSEDYFVAKYADSGVLSWVKQLGVASKLSRAFGIAADASGNSYMAGLTTGGLPGNTQSGTEDAFVARHDTSGTLTWVRQLGIAAGNTSANAISVDGTGNTFVAGYTTGGLAGNTQTGKNDYFLASYNSSGNF